jgi:nucleoside-diphosphate-sugar epimerase
MRVFVTGATGFIGSAIVRELVEASHEVTGLVRSAEAAAKLEAAGAKAYRGTIEDLESLRRGASKADGVVHTAFFHSFGQASLGIRLRVMLGGSPADIVTRFMTAAIEVDRRAIEALGDTLRGGGPLFMAFGTMAMTPGRLAVETDAADPNSVGGLRGRSEETALALAARGVRTSVIRLPPAVHDENRQGFATLLMETARKKGLSAYIGDGTNRWGAVHRLDAAHLFRLALENGKAGARYHGVGEGSIPFRDLAQLIGQQLRVPVKSLSPKEASKHFGWLASFVGTDNPASSEATQAQLHWQPTHPRLMTDISTALHATN